MKPITQEWVEKAEEDWQIALLALNSPQSKAYNAICFHAQLLPTHPLWSTLRPALDSLTTYAIDFRHLGDAADKDEAEEAVKLCHSVRNTVRQGFGLPV